MDEITQVTEADIGRVAVSEDGYYLVEVINIHPVLKDVEVKYLKDAGGRSKGDKVEDFMMLRGHRKMYWQTPGDSSVEVGPGGQMSNLQYLLTKLAEECTEVGQMAAKCQQFGLYEVYDGDGNVATNRERLHAEINDLLGVIDLFNEEEGFDFIRDERAISAKKEKIKKYRNYSINLGFVKGENK